MVYVFFVYGLAFFLLGFGTLLYPKRESRFELARHLDYIAWFGIIHGINEWLDMFMLMGDGGESLFAAARMVTLPLSFVFLAAFGAKAVRLKVSKCPSCRIAVPLLVAAWLTAFFIGDHTAKMWDLWGRYLLCFPASFLTAVGLLCHVAAFRKARMPSAVVNLRLVAGAFFLYGIFAGLIVPKVDFFPASILNYDQVMSLLGVPVQVFRTACAVVAAFGTIGVLSSFQRESRRALRDSELRLQTVASETPVVLLITDLEGTIVFAQGKGFEALKVDPSRLSGRPVSEIFSYAEGQKSRRERTVAGEHFVESIQAADRTLQVYFGPWREEDGRVGGMTCVGLDMTEQVAAEAQLNKYRQEMARTRQTTILGMLSENMAEELGRPLAAALALLERTVAELDSDDNDRSAAEKLKMGLAELERVAAFIDTFYRRAHLIPKATATTIDLQKTAARIAEVFRQPASQVNLRISLENMNAVVGVAIPSREFEQIFFVLIQNAVDAADGGRENHLLIRCDYTDGQIELSFSDTCGGIEPEQAQRVFDPFFKSKDGRRDSGLGLAVVKQIVTTCGGRIDVQSTPHQGTVFRVRLPVEQFYSV